jgi:hypothetical protein
MKEKEPVSSKQSETKYETPRAVKLGDAATGAAHSDCASFGNGAVECGTGSSATFDCTSGNGN